MFTATTRTSASPAEVLEILTNPEAIHDWSPVPFDLDGLDDERLRAGSEARVSGRLGGLTVGFDVTVQAADDDHLELTARGPIGLDVRYDLLADPATGGSTIDASVSVRRGGGLSGRVIAKATEALLAAGALDSAAGRIARAAETPAFA
jgi:polyketide cyclase/dehydrase/lipid transport protein